MSDEAALLHAIRTQPEEDTPRLAYADWLDEQGGEANATRAEYIRVECALARLGGGRFDEPEVAARRKELVVRSRALEKPATKAWESLFRPGRRRAPTCGAFQFSRGLPDCVSLRADEAVAACEPILRLTPVTQLDAYVVNPELLTQLLAAPGVREFPRLQIRGDWRPETYIRPDLSQFAEAEPFPCLKELSLYQGWTLTTDGAIRLAKTTNFPHLEYLNLFDPARSGNGYVHLFDGPFVRTVKTLDIGALPLSNEEVSTVFQSASLSGVKRFRAPRGEGYMALGQSQGEALARGVLWRNIRRLALMNCNEEFVKCLSAAPVTQIERLAVSWSNFGDGGAAALAEAPIWGRLRILDILDNRTLTSKGVDDLVRSAGPALRELEINACAVWDDGAKRLAAAPELACLNRLSLYDSGVGRAGAFALAASPHLGRLNELELVGNRLSAKVKQRLRERFGHRVRW